MSSMREKSTAPRTLITIASDGNSLYCALSYTVGILRICVRLIRLVKDRKEYRIEEATTLAI